MKLTSWQIEVLKRWHAIDIREGKRMWSQPYAMECGACKALAKRGLMEHGEIMGREMYRMTDAGVAAIGGAE